MKTDKSTIDLLFSQRGMFEKAIEDHKRKINRLVMAELQHDGKLCSAASECILEVLADPTIQERYERYTPFMTYEEIEKEVMEKEPRFAESDVKSGLNRLLSETAPRIEQRTKTHKTARYMEVKITTYMLKENA